MESQIGGLENRHRFALQDITRARARIEVLDQVSYNKIKYPKYQCNHELVDCIYICC